MSTIEERVKKIVAEQLGVKEEEVTNSASFVEDLGADSLDTVELVMALDAIGDHRRALQLLSGRSRDDLVVRILTEWDTPLVWRDREYDESDGQMIGLLRHVLAGDVSAADRIRLLKALYVELEGNDPDGALAASTEMLALRMIWYSLSVRVCAGATVIESPVCTPIGSKFSMEQTMMQLSFLSRTTSISYSFQPINDSSISSSLVGDRSRPRAQISSNSSRL